MTPSAEHTLVGQVLDLIGVVHRGRVYVVAIFNQQPKHTEEKEQIQMDVSEPCEVRGALKEKLQAI